MDVDQLLTERGLRGADAMAPREWLDRHPNPPEQPPTARGPMTAAPSLLPSLLRPPPAVRGQRRRRGRGGWCCAGSGCGGSAAAGGGAPVGEVCVGVGECWDAKGSGITHESHPPTPSSSTQSPRSSNAVHVPASRPSARQSRQVDARLNTACGAGKKARRCGKGLL